MPELLSPGFTNPTRCKRKCGKDKYGKRKADYGFKAYRINANKGYSKCGHF